MEFGVQMTVRIFSRSMRKKTRFLSAALVVGFLSGCAGDSDIAQTGTVIWQAIRGSGSKITREQAAAVPYATMAIALGNSSQALLILGTTTPDELDWYTGQQLFVATRAGRITRTAGLPYDLGGRRILQTRTVRSGVNTDSMPEVATLDYPDLGIFDAPLACESRNSGEESVEILGAKIMTRHVVEHCEVAVLHWKFDNDFWLDRTTNYIWRSRQYIHPKSAPIVLEVLRPEQPSSSGM
jgi:hypothetical protein